MNHSSKIDRNINEIENCLNKVKPIRPKMGITSLQKNLKLNEPSLVPIPFLEEKSKIKPINPRISSFNFNSFKI